MRDPNTPIGFKGLAERQRTLQQNKSLHKLFQLIADELNAKGYTVKFVVDKMKTNAEVPWCGASVKEVLWRPIQKALTGNQSTTEISTVEPTDIHQALMHWLVEHLEGVEYIDFPSAR